MRKPKQLLAAATLAAGLWALPASAGTLTFELDTEFSGGTPPAGTAPWVTATFDDSYGTSKQVKLTISAGGLTDQEFMEAFYLNFSPGEDPNGLTLSVLGSDPTSGAQFDTGINAFQADGDGRFDVLIDFPPPPGQFASKFTAGESIEIRIEYTSDITVEDFDVGSFPGGGAGSFGVAAHIQGIGPEGNDSGWIGDGDNKPSVPEPATVLVLGLGLMALGGFAARKRKAS